jgi:hypothetical protein
MKALPSLWQVGARGDDLISSKISFKEEFISDNRRRGVSLAFEEFIPDNRRRGVSLAFEELGVVYS